MIMADKTFGTDQLGLRFGQDARKATMPVGATVCKIKNLSVNFKFHRDHNKHIVHFLQQTEKYL